MSDAYDDLCDRYDASDDFAVKAWDWLTSLPTPPAWLIGLAEYHYRGTTQYVTDVEDWGERR